MRLATIAVKNLEKAKKFYEDTLGLTQIGTEGEEVIIFKSGDSIVNVYQSQYAGTNKATDCDLGGRPGFGRCRTTTKSKGSCV